MPMFHLYYIGCVFVYLMYIYLSSEINIYLSIYLQQNSNSQWKYIVVGKCCIPFLTYLRYKAIIIYSISISLCHHAIHWPVRSVCHNIICMDPPCLYIQMQSNIKLSYTYDVYPFVYAFIDCVHTPLPSLSIIYGGILIKSKQRFLTTGI